LSWWYGLADPIGPQIAGDFDNDSDVDASDLAQSEGDFGVNGLSDADGDGDSDGAIIVARIQTIFAKQRLQCHLRIG